jgi:hypothetical protein
MGTSDGAKNPVVSDVVIRVMIVIVMIAASGVFLINLLQ